MTEYSKLTPPEGEAPMSVRECRLILERLLVVAGAAPGAVAPLREVLFDAEMAGLDLLALLHEEPELLDGIGPAPVAVLNGARVDGGGQLALAVVPAVVDLLVEGVRELRVTGVTRPELLGAVVPGARRAGIAAEVAHGADGAALVRGRPLEAGAAAEDPALTRALREGIRVDGAVWLDLYLRSNGALLAESAVTRRHAGYRDVDDAGRIVKPMDDDVDVERALAAFNAAQARGADPLPGATHG